MVIVLTNDFDQVVPVNNGVFGKNVLYAMCYDKNPKKKQKKYSVF